MKTMEVKPDLTPAIALAATVQFLMVVFFIVYVWRIISTLVPQEAAKSNNIHVEPVMVSTPKYEPKPGGRTMVLGSSARLHTPDANLAQCEIVVYSIDDNATYRNDITFGASNLLSPTGTLNTTYNLSGGQWLHVRVADRSGYKYFISY